MVHEYAYSKKRKKLKTIIAKNAKYQRKMTTIIRKKKGLSKLDKEMLNRFYNCNNQKYIAANWIEKGGIFLFLVFLEVIFIVQ